jgi:hypothetical protein
MTLLVWIDKLHQVLESEIHNENYHRDEYGSRKYYYRAVKQLWA